MLTLLVIVAALVLGYRPKYMTTVVDNVGPSQVLANGVWGFSHNWDVVLEQYGVPFMQGCIRFLYATYVRLTFTNTAIFLIKYVPTGLYMYKLIKRIYVTSRERMKQKQIELEDIQLQIQIAKTKLCVRDAEMTERVEELRRGVERLRRVRARVLGVIASDDVLRQTLHVVHAHADTSPDEDRDFIAELLKDLKCDQVAISERQPENMECGEHAQTEANTSENSVYSSASDVEVQQDYRVKIVRVTNVYKIAYLKHYIKQKRLRRATKQALLKKKRESIKKLLEDWQKTLNMVINTKLTLLNMDSHVDAASEEAMGDFSKPNLRESSDSDSDFKNGTEMCNDEYSLSWTQHPYRNYAYEDIPETAVSREFYDTQGFVADSTFPFCNYAKSSKLCTLMEETTSQVAIEEIKHDDDEDSVCQELEI